MNTNWISRKERYAIADENKAKFKSLYERTGLVEEHPRLKDFLFIKGADLLKEKRIPEYREVKNILKPYSSLKSDCCFLSHRWLDSKHPDPIGRQMAIIKQHINPETYYWVDFCCLPQKPRTKEEEEMFREFMFLLPSLMLKRKFLILRCISDEYFQRAWCFFELLAAHVLGCSISYVYEGGESHSFHIDSEQGVIKQILQTGNLPKDLVCTDPIDMEAITQATETIVTFSLINLISHYLVLGQDISNQKYFFAEDRYYFLATCDFSNLLGWTFDNLSVFGMSLIDLSQSESEASIFSEIAKKKVFYHSTDIYALPKEITLDESRLSWLSTNRKNSDSATNLFLFLSAMILPLSESKVDTSTIEQYLDSLAAKHSTQITESAEVRLYESQFKCQVWDNPNRLSIELDCPPGGPRPQEVLEMAIAGTSLLVTHFEDSGNLGFGCREYLVKPEMEAIKLYQAARDTIKERLMSFYQRGLIRGGTC